MPELKADSFGPDKGIEIKVVCSVFFGFFFRVARTDAWTEFRGVWLCGSLFASDLFRILTWVRLVCV